MGGYILVILPTITLRKNQIELLIPYLSLIIDYYGNFICRIGFAMFVLIVDTSTNNLKIWQSIDKSKYDIIFALSEILLEPYS